MPYKSLVAVLAIFLSLAACTSDVIDNKTDPKWVKQHTPQADIALVFVHGIFGDTLGTWGNRHTSFFDLLEQDPVIGPKVDIYAFGYTSKMLGQGSLGIDEAANLLYARLDQAGVLSYPAVVFINHSMGGLVTMEMLLNHQEMFRTVPNIVFFSTPQSGAEITNIAQHVSQNEALGGMVPGDRNTYIRILNDRWKALDPAHRPRVQCGYEKIDTGPFRVVDWASATRFCDEPALAISANHIDIVKPDSAASDSFLVVQRALKPLMTKTFKPQLATPDFAVENGQPLITIDQPSGTLNARVQNIGGGMLRYSLDQWPNGLHLLWPGPGEHTLEADQTEKLQIALVWGTRNTEYHFKLRSNAADPQTILVRVRNLEAIESERAALAGEALDALGEILTDPARRSALASASIEEANDRVAHAVHAVVAKRNPDLVEGGQWVLAAELLAAGNWPEFATSALRQARQIDAAVFANASVKLLAGNVAALSGEPIEGASAPSLDLLSQWAAQSRTPFTSEHLLPKASRVSDNLQQFPALKPSGLSLEGDIARARGRPEQAIRSYKDLAILNGSPLNELRMKTIEGAALERPIA
jgi:pimeloyl-ACP methyl ester carboxylesterase